MFLCDIENPKIDFQFSGLRSGTSRFPEANREIVPQPPHGRILGPRQCGKTTLARDYIAALADRQIHYFDLEDPGHLNRLADPKLALEPLGGPDRHRRDPAHPRIVPAVARIDRIAKSPEPALSDPRQRVPRVDPPVFRNARGQDRVPGAAPVHRLRGRRSPPPVATGRVFLRRISRSPTTTAWSGERLTSPPSWSGTCRPWASTSPPIPCADSG